MRRAPTHFVRIPDRPFRLLTNSPGQSSARGFSCLGAPLTSTVPCVKQRERKDRPNASLDVPQRSGGVGEVRSIQRLYAGIMLPVKRSYGAGAARFLGIGGIF